MYIDWTRLKDLREDVGGDGFAEVLELFLDELEAGVMLLSADPGKTSESQLHALKGAARNLGMEAVGQLCHDGEVSCADVGIDADFAVQLQDVYAASKTELMSGLERMSRDAVA